MNDRLELHSELCEQQGSNYVYFDAPENIQLHIPCIKYQIARPSTKRADDKLYFLSVGYEVTVVNKSQDEGRQLTFRLLEHFKLSSFNRHYVADNIHHFVLTIFY